MNQNKIIAVGLLVAGLFGGYLLSSFYPVARVAPQYSANVPSISIVKEWRATVTGDIVEVKTGHVVISSDGQTLDVSFASDVSISKVLVSDQKVKETIEGLTIDDIKVGSTVALGIIADSQGNIRTDKISFIENQ